MKAAQSQDGQIGEASWPFTTIATVAPSAATSTSPIRPSAAIHEHDRRGQRLRLRGPRRVADADDVAADVARQEVVEEPGDEIRRQQRARRHLDALRAQQQLPAPRARQHVDEVERRARSRATRPTRGARRPTARPTSTREKRNASSPMLTATSTASTMRRRGDARRWTRRTCQEERRDLYYGFVRKSRHRMRILMIAPEPFFEPRGTPFSEFHRIRALTDLGHEVDLVTYPFGQDVAMPGPARVPIAAAAVRAQREDRPVACQAAARCAAVAHGPAPRARRRGTTRSTRTRRAG